MAQPRNPTNGQFAGVSPQGAARTSIQFPQPGPAAQDMADPLPFLPFQVTPSPNQTMTNRTAISGPPGDAGPRSTIPTQQMQDFGQTIGQTIVPNAPDGDTAASGT